MVLLQTWLRGAEHWRLHKCRPTMCKVNEKVAPAGKEGSLNSRTRRTYYTGAIKVSFRVLSIDE